MKKLTAGGGILLPIIADVIANLFWGFSYMFSKIALGVTTPEILLSIRFVTAFLMMNVVLLITRQRIRFKGKHLLPLIVLLIMEPAGFYGESYGLVYTNSTLSGIVLAVIPIFAMGCAALFLKEFPSRRQLIFSVFPVVGVILITISGNKIGAAKPIGFLFLFMTCICYSLYRTANRSCAQEFSTTERTYLVLGTSAAVFTIAALVSVHGDIGAYLAPLKEVSFTVPMLTLALFCSVGSNIFANYSMKYLTVLQYSVIGTISTLCSMFGGVIFLHEPMTGMMLCGTLMILLGISQVTRSDQKKADKAD